MKRILFLVAIVAMMLILGGGCENQPGENNTTGEANNASPLEDGALTEEDKSFTEEETIDPMAYYVRISPDEAKEMMDNLDDIIIVDVRTEDEFRQGHIEGAILIPDYELDKMAGEMLPDKDAVILIYCRSGNRSQLASYLLIGMGYENIYDFGGILDWRYGEVQEPS